MAGPGRLVSIFSIAVLTIAGGCSHSKPTEGDGEKVARKIFAANCKGDCIDVTDFTKTNGISGKIDGMKVYILEYDCTAKTKVNCSTNLTFPAPKDPLPVESFHASTDKDSFHTDTKAGTVIQFKGEMKFIQTEKGWRAEGDKDDLF